jgi:hypothetical protein
MAISKVLTKDEQITEELKRLEKIFAGIDSHKKQVNKKLIANAAFMAVTLQELQERINLDGAVMNYVNGNGIESLQEHPAQKSYNTMINRYTAIMKQLTDLLDTKDQKSDHDTLMEFIK